MKTLVIHPSDCSTDFLKPVYGKISSLTVITGGVNRKELMGLIDGHDRVMMMGHGSPHGLFSVGQFSGLDGNPYIIDEQAAEVLRVRKELVFIWCYASDFMVRHRLDGFATGMFISEVPEAIGCGIKNPTRQQVDQSNLLFVEELGDCINQGVTAMFDRVANGAYRTLAKHNSVAKYNHALFRVSTGMTVPEAVILHPPVNT